MTGQAELVEEVDPVEASGVADAGTDTVFPEADIAGPEGLAAEDETATGSSQTARERYFLTTEQRTYPAHQRNARVDWFKPMVELQQALIEKGVHPQRLIGLPQELKDDWLAQVWNLWVKSRPKGEQRVIMETGDEGVLVEGRDWRWLHDDERDAGWR